MSADADCPQSLLCPEASNSRETSPMPEPYGPEEDYTSLQMSSAETADTETVSPLPSSMDLLIQDSPDSSTSPRVKPLPTSAESSTEKQEEKVQVKKQKVKTWFQNQRMKCKRWQKNNWPRNSSSVTQAWNSQFSNCVEEFLQPHIQLQQNSPFSDLEAALESAGESHNVIQQAAKYVSPQQQIMDLFPSYSMNMQPEDV
ncbi:Homeobox protein NANOG [Camelus dromedarius]|uniref:Homeobox protein NANOG n=1 Tax=Camelus dromedarius TaxID=9838 RepID=A0A5N4C7C9_CAMDR|nr:Homeobox protein NANOG [Camelus dromedarius]